MPRKAKQVQIIDPEPPIPKLALTVAEAAQVLSLGLNSTRDLITSGEIKAIRTGKRGTGWIVPVTSLTSYLAKATGVAS